MFHNGQAEVQGNEQIVFNSEDKAKDLLIPGLGFVLVCFLLL